MTPAAKRWPWITLTVVSLALILRVTLVPTQDVDTGTFRTCLLCGEFGLSDAIGNVALFMPVALGLYLSGVPGRRTIALLFVLSGSIELLQLAIPGRDSTISDALSNTLGAAAGVGLAYWLPRRRRTARAGLLAAAGILGLILAIGYTLAPSLPRSIYYGQWTPELGQYESYHGRVLSAEIGGMPLHSWRVDDSRPVRDRLLGGAVLRVEAVAGPATRATAPIFSMFDKRQREIVLLGADGGDLVLHVRLRATDLLLRQPDLRWCGALAPLAVGDTFALALRRARSGYCLELNGRERCGIAYTAGEAWGMIQYFPHLPATAQAVLSALVMALVGMGLGVVVRRDALGYLAIGLALAGAAVLPALVGLAPTPLVQLGGLAVGIAGGVFIP